MPQTTMGIRQRLQRYDDADLALFEQYRPNRAEHRPVECKRSGFCWVEHGPPAYATNGNLNGGQRGCIECKAHPR